MPPVSRTLAAGILLTVVAWCAGCGGDVPDAVAPAASRVAWRAIGAWSGRLNHQTESFEVSTTPLRLRWRTRETSPGAGRLTVTLHSAVSGRPLQTILDVRGSGAGTIAVADEPRWCHFTIEAVQVEYELTLEEAFATVSLGRGAPQGARRHASPPAHP